LKLAEIERLSGKSLSSQELSVYFALELKDLSDDRCM